MSKANKLLFPKIFVLNPVKYSFPLWVTIRQKFGGVLNGTITKNDVLPATTLFLGKLWLSIRSFIKSWFKLPAT